jgi:hypothetical protein
VVEVQVLQLAIPQAVQPAGAKYLPVTQVSQVPGRAQEAQRVLVPKQSSHKPLVGFNIFGAVQAEQ